MSTQTPTNPPTDMPKPNPLPQPGPPASRASTLSGNQESQYESLNNLWGDAQFTDESSHLFSLYLSYAEKQDKEQTDNWKAGADGILVFTGLFAAALATFVSDSYKSLSPDTGRDTVTILKEISQQLSNGSQIPAQAQASLSSFQPSTSAVWISALWSLSFVISLFCALLATLQQNWARRFLRRTQPQCAIHKRARLRAYFAEGVDRFHVAFAIEAIPSLLHISMFLFLTGLVISLFTIHHTIAYITLAATIACGLVYTAITLMPVFYHDSPYHSPLSALAWDVPRKTAKALLSVVSFIRADSIPSLSTKVSRWKTRLSVSMARAEEKAAENQHWSIDARALGWTLDRSDEESELERFVAGIPRFTRSKAVENPMGVLKSAMSKSTLRPSLYRDITTLLINAADPGLLPTSKEMSESVRQRRIGSCLEALYFLPQAIEKILRRVSKTLGNELVRRGFVSVLESVVSWNMALRLSEVKKRNRKDNIRFERVIIAAQCMATVIATRLPVTMRSEILTRQLGISKADELGRYLESGDSFLLKNLNHFLANTVLNFIHVEDTDIFLSTVDILLSTVDIFKGPRLNLAAEELRVEFENQFTRIARQADDLKESETVRSNARQLLSKLACLRHPVPAPGQTNTPTATHPSGSGGSVATVSPTQFPQPQVPSPPPGDAYISFQPYAETPSGETFPLIPMASPLSFSETLHSATPPATPTPTSRDISS